MINILFIVPYPELKETVSNVIKNHPDKSRLNTKIIVATVDKVSDIDINIDINKFDIIVARGYTAEQIKKEYHSLKIVELVISSYDIIRSLQECIKKFNPKKVAFCGFYGALNGAKEFGNIVGFDIKVYNPSSYKELDRVIKQAKNEGYEAVIGGYSAQLYANRLGLNSVIITTGQEAILQSFNEAIRTADLLKEERVKAEMYRIITKSSKEGIIYVDKEGTIRVDNNRAREIMQKKSLCYIKLKDEFSFLEEGFYKSLESGKEVLNHINKLQGKRIISVSYTPVVIRKEVSGVVIKLIDITYVQELESQIRRKLNEKGLTAKYDFNDVIHKSEIMKKTIEIAKLYANSTSNIIIVGETGTGKEVFAQSIHNSSLRKDGPFVALNCAALPENLLESELFGYVEGAFTGTNKGGKMGLFEQAHNGTIFLDEISEIAPNLQSKLLRVLQEHEVRRIGDDKVVSVNVRVISATNKSLRSLVEKGKFREDLLYRLDVLRVFLPPLRKREEDVEELFLHLLNKMYLKNRKTTPNIDKSTLKLLYNYNFPGNVRELTNIVERVCVLNNEEYIDKDVLVQALYPKDIEYEEIYKSDNKTLDKIKYKSEIEMIKWALDECEGNKTKAAKLLGIDRTTLWRKINSFKNII